VLVALRHITVWSGSQDVSSRETLSKQVTTTTYTVEAKDTVLDLLATSLFRCNTTIAYEALEIFYYHNTFHVTGFEIWNPMYKWLHDIGSRNRQQLQTITPDMQRPKLLEIDAYNTGTLKSLYAPFPCVHSVGSHDITVWDTPHYLDPAIKACFRILGESGATLSLRLWMGKYLPGVVLWEDEQVEDAYCWGGMDIPNEIERVHKPYASRINVLCQCQGGKSKHIKQKELI
jgi:hypothetical protein